MGTFVQRLVDVTFALAGGKKFVEGGDTVKLSGLRMRTKIVKAGGVSMGRAELEIYGMTPSVMNQLSTLGMQIILVPLNTVTIEAGDVVSGMTQVFYGTIKSAYIDFTAAPDVCFRVEAFIGLAAAVADSAASSFTGNTDVAQIMSGLAKQMGYGFENNGINAKLSSPYFSGSARDQARACAEAAGISWIIDDGKLIIWPRLGARDGPVPLISPTTGMVGYPSYTANGIELTVLFNPAIKFGGKIQVVSSLKPANAIYSVYMIDYDLDTRAPNGRFFTRLQGYNPNYPQPLLQ